MPSSIPIIRFSSLAKSNIVFFHPIPTYKPADREKPGRHFRILVAMKKLFAPRSNQEAAVEAPRAAPELGSAPMEHAAGEALGEQQKRGVAGLVACLLPLVTDGSEGVKWSKTYLKLVVELFLGLPASQTEAYTPVLTAKKAALEARAAATRSSSGFSLNFRSSAGTESSGAPSDEGELDPAPFLALIVPDNSRQKGLKGWLKKHTQLKKDKAERGPESPGIDLSLDEFRVELLKKQLWFTVKAIGYDARARILLRLMALAMDIQWAVITHEEVVIGRTLFAEASAMPLEKAAAKPTVWDWKRNAAIGVAAVTGGALLAVTGGLAAPAIAASLTALGGAGVAIGAAVGSTAGVTATTILFGTAGAGVVGMKTDTRTRGVHEFNFDLVSAGDGMNVYICVSGWLDEDDPPARGFRRAWGDSREYLRAFYQQKNPEKVDQVDQVMDRYKGREDDFFAILRRTYSIEAGSLEHDPLGLGTVIPPIVESKKKLKTKKSSSSDKEGDDTQSAEAESLMRAWRWKDRFQQGDQYCLVWEEVMLRRFGKSMRSFAAQQISNFATTELVQYTALAALFTAVAIPRTIFRMADMIDNIWVIAMNSADQSGKLLAQSLLERKQGLRPVTLIGYGMGARLIYSCLKHLAKLGKDECFGIVENAVLLGSPVPVVRKDWASARSMVAGRLINGYSENDWMLAIMYRYQGWALNSAGIGSLDIPGVENVDLSGIVQGHLEYKSKIGAIMDVIQLER